MIIINETTQAELADHAEVAQSFVRRAIGLLNHQHLPVGHAMIFPGANSVHTYFMRFPIDVLLLKGQTVVDVHANVRPFRLAGHWGADTVIELPAGTLATTRTQLGHRVIWQHP